MELKTLNDFKEQSIRVNKEWYRKNKEYVKEYNRQYHKRHRKVIQKG